MVTNPNFYDAYPVVSLDKENSRTVEELQLWYNCIGRKEYAGTILRQERTWQNFYETEYRNSQGIIQKCCELSDGTRTTVHYDAATGDYTSYLFDYSGTLLRKESQNRYGDYEISERQPDGTMAVTKGTTIFIKRLPDMD